MACFGNAGELATLLDMTVRDLALKLLCVTEYQCCCGNAGELAALLDMTVRDLALKLVPAALPKLTEDEDTASLEALAAAIGLDLQRMMRDHGHHVVAKYLCVGPYPHQTVTRVCWFWCHLPKQDTPWSGVLCLAGFESVCLVHIPSRVCTVEALPTAELHGVVAG